MKLHEMDDSQLMQEALCELARIAAALERLADTIDESDDQ